MAAQKKVFKRDSSKKVDTTPIQFEYYGVDLEAKRAISSLDTLRYIEGLQSDDDGDRVAAVRLYIEKSFDSLNLKKLERVIDDPENGIEISDLAELMNYLAEERAERPTEDAKQS